MYSHASGHRLLATQCGAGLSATAGPHLCAEGQAYSEGLPYSDYYVDQEEEESTESEGQLLDHYREMYPEYQVDHSGNNNTD